MERLILKAITTDFFSKKSKLLICTITYYTILALIPSIIAIVMILETLKIDINFALPEEFIDLKTSFSTITIFAISIYFIGRIFYILSSRKKSKNALIISMFLSFISIIVLMSFLFTFFIKLSFIRFAIHSLLITLILSLINYFFIDEFRLFSIVISGGFSLIIMGFFHFFLWLSKDFISLDNYYGFLGPVFMSILAIHIAINIAYLNYSTTKAYTKFSGIKFVR